MIFPSNPNPNPNPDPDPNPDLNLNPDPNPNLLPSPVQGIHARVQRVVRTHIQILKDGLGEGEGGVSV